MTKEHHKTLWERIAAPKKRFITEYRDALGLVAVSVSRAYPLRAAKPSAPSASTAGLFCLGKIDENRLLLHPALRCAPGPLPPAPDVASYGWRHERPIFENKIGIGSPT